MIIEKPAYSLKELSYYFLKLGTIGFGGPVALVSYLHRDLVENKKWISEDDYKEGLALSQLAPGPLAAQLSIYIGYIHYRIIDATIAGLAFVLPSFLITAYKNIEVSSVTTRQMIEIDRIAMEETGPNLYQIMENAGRNLCMLTIEKLCSDWDKAKILVLAGTGGNGGGGICAARHLANHGADLKVCITEPEKLKEVTAFQLHILKSTIAKVISIDDLQNENPDLIIDAIIGYSLTGEPAGTALEMINWASVKQTLIISLAYFHRNIQ